VLQSIIRDATDGDNQPEHGEDVTWASRVFASLQTSSKLTNRHQNVDIVAADKVLSQIDDSRHQRLLKSIPQHLHILGILTSLF